MTKEAILELLKSAKFTDFAQGIEQASTYFKENGKDDLILEEVLTVFTYHLDHKHEEIAAAYEKLGKNFTLFFLIQKTGEEASSNWFTQGQVEGLSTFLTHYREGKLDTSEYFMASGFVYQMVAQSCQAVLKLTDRAAYADECEALEQFYAIFDELWKIQMTVQGMFRSITNWDDFYLVHLVNKTLERADLESQSRIMAGISAHENNPEIQRDIVEVYLKQLDLEIKKLEAQKNNIEGLKEKILDWFPGE